VLVLVWVWVWVWVRVRVRALLQVLLLQMLRMPQVLPIPQQLQHWCPAAALLAPAAWQSLPPQPQALLLPHC
jgi:hypothetical protein